MAPYQSGGSLLTPSLATALLDFDAWLRLRRSVVFVSLW